MTRLLRLLIPLGWLLATLPQAARAQSPPAEAVSAPDPCLANARCKELADRSQAEYQAQQHEAALASSSAAFAIQPVPWLLFNIGRIHQKLGRTDEALTAYRTFLQQSQAADEATQRDKARAYVEQVERERAAQAIAVIPATPATPATPPPPKKKPIYKKWWFWTIVGGAAAAVVVGTAVGVSAQKPDLSDVPRFRLFPTSQ